MKKLEQIKDQFAKEKREFNFLDLINSFLLSHDHEDINSTINELLILVQKECLNNAQQQLSLENHGVDSIDYGLTNENNIIK